MLVERKDQHWFRRTYVKKFLELVYIHRSTAKLGDEDQKFRAFLQAEGGFHSMTDWFGSKYHQNKADNLLSVTSTLYVIVNSRSDKGKTLKEHIRKDLVPRGFDERIAELQKKHHHAATQFKLAIQERDNQIRSISIRTWVFKANIEARGQEIAALQKRHVGYISNKDKNNVEQSL